MIMILICICTV